MLLFQQIQLTVCCVKFFLKLINLFLMILTFLQYLFIFNLIVFSLILLLISLNIFSLRFTLNFFVTFLSNQQLKLVLKFLNQIILLAECLNQKRLILLQLIFLTLQSIIKLLFLFQYVLNSRNILLKLLELFCSVLYQLFIHSLKFISILIQKITFFADIQLKSFVQNLQMQNLLSFDYFTYQMSIFIGQNSCSPSYNCIFFFMKAFQLGLFNYNNLSILYYLYWILSTMKKKVDSRIQTLIQNNIKQHQRSMFFLIGDRARYQVVNFHYILTRNTLKSKPNVLWCYSKDLQFSSHQTKRMKDKKNKQMKGLYDENVDDPFDVFISSTQIRYNFYHQSHKILGNTYQMLILQDFESITPNVLCRTIQTVEGGGIIIFIMKKMQSLKQLYTLAMDVHKRYRTQGFNHIQPRFNERFILSLSQCKSCILMDDQLNVLKTTSSFIDQIKPVQEGQIFNKKAVEELQILKNDLSQKQIIGSLLQTSKTLDQAKVIMSLVDVLSDKNNKTTLSLTAARGRGKSAAIGLGIAAAVKLGYGSIFVTAPSPNNLKTLFQFVVQGLQILGFKDRMDFEKIHSNNKEYQNAVMRINIFKTHTQFIQFVFPNDADKIGHTDLVVIDQAAAIPLPYVRSFLGPYCVFLSSTINGYEGTGRSLSLKLLQQIKDQNRKGNQLNFRKLKQVVMIDPIRYAINDQVQKWLNNLLLLNATEAPPLKNGIPHPNDCQLYLVNRDTLFNYKKVSQKFLHNLMSLFISSHYKNSPNDLQLISDSSSHMIFILVGPLKTNQQGKAQMPDILCAIQVALQGNLSSSTLQNNSQRGYKPSGDLIPWNIRQQFQDYEFPKMAGARIVRIATHPMTQKMGYGSRALSLLASFFQKKIKVFSNENQIVNYNFKTQDGQKATKSLLKRLQQVNPPDIHYLGTCFGFTTNLVKFWRKNGYEPVYLKQGVNDITAQYSGIMLRTLQNQQYTINLKHYVKDFCRRFINLLGFQFKNLSPGLALQIIQYTNRKRHNLQENTQNTAQNVQMLPKHDYQLFITPFDFNRLKSYASNQSDFHLILDLVPNLAKLYFTGMLGHQNFNYSWQAILVGIGLQHKTMEKVSQQIGQGDKIKIANILALFHKTMIRFFKISKKIYEGQIENNLPAQKKIETSSYYRVQQESQKKFAEEQLKNINNFEDEEKKTEKNKEDNIKRRNKQFGKQTEKLQKKNKTS